MYNSERARELAKEHFKNGYNCAESVILAFCELTGRDPQSLLSVATCFGGGVGRSGCICGALAGGVIALGSIYGRKSSDDDKKRPYGLASRLFNQFTEEFGSSCCQVINKGDFKSKEHVTRCSGIAAKTAEMLFKILEAEGINLHVGSL